MKICVDGPIPVKKIFVNGQILFKYVGSGETIYHQIDAKPLRSFKYSEGIFHARYRTFRIDLIRYSI